MAGHVGSGLRLAVSLALALASACSGSGEPRSARRTPAVTPVVPGSVAPPPLDEGAAGTSFGNAGGAAPVAPSAPAPDEPLAAGDCGVVTQTAEARALPTDIIWAIDTSASMQAARDALQQELNAFSQRISDAGIDAHIVLLGATDQNFCFGPGLPLCIAPPLGSGQCGGGTLAVAKVGLGLTAFCASAALAGPGLDSTESFVHLNAASGETMQLDTIVTQYEAYAHLLRPEAQKQLVITGDGDATQSVEQFQQALAALDPAFSPDNTSFSAIYCKSSCAGVCPLPATAYPGFVQSMNGVEGDLCAGQAGFAAVIDQLATAVIVGAQLACEWAIPPPPAGETFDSGKVNVRYTDPEGQVTDFARVPPGADCAEHDGWIYDDDDAPARIRVCPRTCEALQAGRAGGRMDLELGCETRFVDVL